MFSPDLRVPRAIFLGPQDRELGVLDLGDERSWLTLPQPEKSQGKFERPLAREHTAMVYDAEESGAWGFLVDSGMGETMQKKNKIRWCNEPSETLWGFRFWSTFEGPKLFRLQ